MAQLKDSFITGDLRVTGDIYGKTTNATLADQVTAVRDKSNGTLTYLNYSASGMSSTSWVGSWDGYTLKAISPQALRNTMGLGNTTGVLPIANGGTGLSASPSMLTNLGSTSAANVLQASPRPGVTGTLPIANGGTGKTTAADAWTALGGGASGKHADSYFALASHGNHVPATQTANNAVFLRNDNTWQTVTPANIGAATSGHTHTLSIATDSGTNQLSLAANTKYKLTAGGSSYIFTTPPDNNTDTKVTSVGNHYTPAADSSAALSADASSTTAATWNSTSLVTGVNLQRDAKGHVTGVTVDSIRMPANPNTDHYAWGDITSKPATATRWPTWDEVTGKPSSFTPTSHSHGNITNDGKIGSTANYAVYTTTNGVLTASSLATNDPSASGSGITYIATISQDSKGKITATKSTVRDASASQSGVVSTGAQSFSGKKTVKFSSRIHPLVGASNERSSWYKITFPYYNATTTTSAKWFMNSFDLHFGGGYSSNPSGIAHVAFYWTRAKEDGTWALSQGYARIDGILTDKIAFYYRVAEPGILYINNTANNYNGIWLDNLYVDDTAPSLDWATTLIETCSAISIADYTKVPTSYTYGDANGYFRIASHTYPSADNIYYLGSNSLRWKEVHSANFYGGLTGNVSGNATTATMPLGFTSRTENATWGNTTGTSITSWNDSTGGSIAFRRDNPSSGKLSVKVDGRFYFNEGNTPVAGLKSANSYWGMTGPDGEDNVWIRTTTQGILPYQSGGTGNGHNSIGTSSWYFSTAYIDNVYGKLKGNADTATKLATARTISLTGSVTGSGSFDGSGNLSIATTTNHTHTTSLAAGGTSTINLAANTAYTLTAGGTSVVFKTPADNNTTYNFSGTTFYSGANGVAEHDANNAIKNGHYYYTSNGPATSLGASTGDGALYVQSYSDSWVGQIAQDYRNGALFVRGKNNGTWQSWQKVYDTGHKPSKSDVGLGSVANIDQSKAIKSITRSGTTFTYTCLDNTTGTFTQQDNNTTYSAGTGLGLSGTTFSVKLGYTTSGNNRAVQADSNGNLYVVQKDDNTNTDTLVTQTATNTNANYEVLFSATADNTTRTETARKYNNFLFNPSTGNLQVTQINGVTVGSSPKFTDNNTTYSAGTGISLSGTTFSNSGVRSIATGSANGTISVNTNGTSVDVAVKGLGSAAYTASTAYATASHNHDSTYVNITGDTMSGSLIITKNEAPMVITKDSTHNGQIQFGISSNHKKQGLYSTGYSTDGTTWTENGLWIISREADGSVVLKGNADTATKATKDSSGHTITSTYALKPSTVAVTVAASSWSGSSAPYTATISVSGVTASSTNLISLSSSITTAQLQEAQAANIQDGSQATNSITLKAWGVKPTGSIPLNVTIIK